MWQNLNTLQKALVVIFISLIVPLTPELIFIADLGGVELVFSFLILYYQPLLLRIKAVFSALKSVIQLSILAFTHSAFFKANVFVTQASFAAIAFVLTGSLTFCTVFFMPALLINGVLI